MHPEYFNVRALGATGDGVTLDTDAINQAVENASSAGGGTVYFPAGNYLSFSIRLRSNVTLYLDSGAVIVAADPMEGSGSYDPAEPNEWDAYQDFGHSHWRNSTLRDVPTFRLTNVEDFSLHQSAELPDTLLERVQQRKL